MTAGMAIFDTINFLQCDVVTYCVVSCEYGNIASSLWHRRQALALPNSRVMIHQPTGGATGQTSDISIAAKEILRATFTMKCFLSIRVNCRENRKDSDRDYYMSALEAKYGVVDQVIESKPKSSGDHVDTLVSTWQSLQR